jgi:hypothetical protein
MGSMTVYARKGTKSNPQSPGYSEVLRGPKGDMGPKGDPGASTGEESLYVAEAVTQFQVCRYVSPTEVGPASASSAAHAYLCAGICITPNPTIGKVVQILNRGQVYNASWSWIPGDPVFVGVNGALTQTYDPLWAFLITVGTALDTHTIQVYLRPPIM